MAQNDVLFAKMKGTIKVLVGSKAVEDKIFSTGFYILSPKENISKDFLYFFFLTDSFNKQKDSLCTGATMSGLNNAGLKRIKILLPIDKNGNPDLAEQNRMVAILAEAEKLKKKCAEADEKMDVLIPSFFIEMFGNPEINHKKWEVETLRNVSEKISDGPFGSNLKTEHYTSSGVRVIRLKNIGVGTIIDNDRAYVSEEHADFLKKHICVSGDVIAGTLGDPNLRAIILPAEIPRAINKADCVQIRPKSNVVTAEFLCWLLNSPHTLSMASGMISGQTRSRISMGRLAELRVPVPPFDLQKEFSRLVKVIESQKEKQKRSAEKINDIFQSLLSGVFTGK